MASQGPNAPGTMADDAAVGTKAWNTPDNAKVKDGTLTSFAGNLLITKYSHYLKATNFGFSIPAGSTIDGITVTLWKSRNSYINAYDEIVKLVVEGVVSGSNYAKTSENWNNTVTDYYYGGVSNLWGLAPSVAQINASNFGVVLQGKTVSTKTAGTANVDFISITVTYTEGGGGASGVPKQQMHYARQRR